MVRKRIDQEYMDNLQEEIKKLMALKQRTPEKLHAAIDARIVELNLYQARERWKFKQKWKGKKYD